MPGKICGWPRYIRGAILRRFGATSSLQSSLFFILLCVVFLYTFHLQVVGKPGKIPLVDLALPLGPYNQYSEEEIAHEETPEYRGVDQSAAPKGRGGKGPKNKGQLKKFNKNKKRKGFHSQFPIAKKLGSIGSRKDKLMFPRSVSLDKSRLKLPVVVAVNNGKKPKQKLQPYQEDVITDDDDIEWSLEREQERRREMRQRSLQVRRECDNDVRGRLSRRLVKVYEHLKWVDRYELVYCPIFKAGSTTWMKNLLMLAGETNFNGSIHNRVNMLYQVPGATQRAQKLLDKSMKFMIVRHPFDRLLSAYRDKMLRVLKVDDPYRRLQHSILQNYGGIKDKRTSSGQEDVAKNTTHPGKSFKAVDHPSFLQFLNKVRDEMKFFWQVMDGTQVDPHWTPYWYSCSPCQIRYDVIAKIETLELDQEFLLRATNLKGILPNARTHASKFDGYSDTDTAAAEYFKDIPVELLKELEKLYLPDFKLFGYTAEKYINMADAGA